MKNFYLLSLLLFLGKITFAQTIPFGFHNPKVFLIEKLTEKINGAKKPTDKNSQIDSTKSPESSKSKKKYSNYDELADSLDAKASTLETNANNVYNTGMDALSKSTPADQGGLTIMNDKIKSLNDARSTAMTTVKTFRKAAEGYRYLARADKGFTLFVVHNAVDAQIYYNGMISDSKAKFLSNSLLSFGTDGGKASLFNELYADYFGPLRFSFGALISSKQQVPSNSDTTKGTQQDAVQRLLGGGGMEFSA
jgi:hypothetical protein